VLHPGVEGHHGQIVGVHDIVDVPGEPHGKFGERDCLGIAAPRGASLDIHRRATRGLTDASAHILLSLAQSLHEPHGSRGFSFAERGGGDRRHLDIFSVGFLPQAVDDLHEVQFGQPAVRHDFIFFQPHLRLQLGDGFHLFFRSFRDLPVRHFGCIIRHTENLLLFCGMMVLNDPAKGHPMSPGK
jgi:hypothetical protein